MGDSRIGVSWSSLLPDLLISIGKCLDAEIDVLRFRAVCKSWRSCATPLKKFPCETIKLPFPFGQISGASVKHDDAYFTLVERIVYRIELPGDGGQPNFWLVKVERLSNGKLRIVNPASHHLIKDLAGTGIQVPKELNTLDFRVSEVCKAYALRCVNETYFNFREDGEYRHAKKVICRKGIENDDYCVMAIDTDSKLWYINSGDDKWTSVPSNDMSDNYVDIVNLKGEFYAIDEWGFIWGFNSMFEPAILANSTLHFSSERHLVPSNDGRLHLVEAMTGEDICTSSGGDRLTSYFVSEAVLGFRIWTLNRRERAWGEAEWLNGLIIFAGDDCSFSFPSIEFDGSNGYRVFFTSKCISFQTHEETGPPMDIDSECNCCGTCQNVIRVYKTFISNGDLKRKFRGLQGHNTGVCDFQTGRIGSLLMYNEFADIFWPPPSWLSRP